MNISRLNHAVLFVRSATAAAEFYAKVLGFRVSDWIEDWFVFMRCNPDHHTVNFIRGSGVGLHHLAFELATLDEVFRARDHLKEAGATITYQGRRRAGCQVSVEFLDPDGHHLELYWGVDQIGSDGRSRPAEEWRQTATLEDAVRIAPPGQDTTLYDAALRARLETGSDRG